MKKSSRFSQNLSVTLSERHGRFRAAINALENLAESGDWYAISKLAFFDHIRDSWSGDRKLKFLCCSLSSLQLSLYCQRKHNPKVCSQSDFKGKVSTSFCQMRWCCDFCYRAHMYGLRPSLTKGEEGDEKQTKRLGQSARWKDAIISNLREHVMFLGPAYFLTWHLPDGIKLNRSHLDPIDLGLKRIKERNRYYGNPSPWMLPIRVDGFKNQVRGVYLGIDSIKNLRLCISIQSKSLEIQSHRSPEINDLQTPIEMLKKGDFGPWTLTARPAFYWFDESKRPLRMTRPDFFRANLDRSIDWLIGDSTPWSTDPATCLRLAKEMANAHLFRVFSDLSNWHLDNAFFRMILPDNQGVTAQLDSAEFFGEFRPMDGSCTHDVKIDDECLICGAKDEFVIGI